MLQDIRSQFLQGPIAKILSIVIALSFVLFGIDSILFGGSDDTISLVNGEEILEKDLQESINNRMRQLATMLDDDYDFSNIDQDKIKAEVLSGLITKTTLMQLVSELGLTIGESELGAEISSMESFHLGGRFSADLYRSIISGAGYTPATFKARTREDLLLKQFYTGIGSSDFITPLELELEAKIVTEKRDVRYLILPLTSFEEKISVTEPKIEKYYSANRDNFTTEEKIKVEYLEIKIEDFFQPVSEEDLKNEFNAVKADYERPSENRISHILFEKKETESVDTFENRISEAELLLSQGAIFSDVVEKFSDDVGSIASGGDLGYSSGDTFPEQMEDAISKLSVGEMSTRVTTQSGVHLLLLTDRIIGTEVTIDELRAELDQQIKERLARQEMMTLIEELKDVVFNSQDLTEPAKVINTDVKTSIFFPSSGTTGKDIFSNNKVVQAAFSEEVRIENYNSDVIEISKDHFVVLRKYEHKPVSIEPIERVRAKIIELVRKEEARNEALVKARDLSEQIIKGQTSIENIALTENYEWQVQIGATRSDNQLPPEISAQVFSTPSDVALPFLEVVSSEAGVLYVVELARIIAGGVNELSTQEKTEIRNRLAQLWGSTALDEIQRIELEDADIEIF